MYANGAAPDSALVDIFGCKASPDMARRVYATKRDMLAETGAVLIVNEIYRTLAGQDYQIAYWTARGTPWFAAPRGTSNHGKWTPDGAVDWACADQFIPARRIIAARYGLIHDISYETWHATKRNEGTSPLPTLEEALGGGAPSPITLEMLEEREFMSIKEDLLKALGRGGSVVYKNTEINRSYSVSPRCIKHHGDKFEMDIALRESGQTEEGPINVSTYELVRVFRNNGLGEFADERLLRSHPTGALFVPDAKF